MSLETSAPASGSISAIPAQIRVWDLPTRLFHWVLVGLVIAMVFTGWTGKLDLHMTLGQALLSPEERLAHLRSYYPLAEAADWELQVAGLRVQIIKSEPKLITGEFGDDHKTVLGKLIGTICCAISHDLTSEFDDQVEKLIEFYGIGQDPDDTVPFSSIVSP